ncbi:protein singed wings 2 isoform X2 [Chelonus insularis]|nr:protein singed wings 2 isoform X2 [Chelonus insularis]XP_034949512.1 protein singed wings 2 isoform X2 [Chelonus insularis]
MINRSHCYLKNNNHHHLFCYGNISLENLEAEITDVVWVLTICEWSAVSFDPHKTLQNFPNLRKLIIANGNLTRITTLFPEEAKKLEDIHIIRTKLWHIPHNTFKNLSSLRNVDLRDNALSEINPELFNKSSTLLRIYLGGNPWKCNENMSWIVDIKYSSLTKIIIDKEKLHCTDPYKNRPVIAVMQIIMNLKQECKYTACNCELLYVVRQNSKHNIQKHLMAFITVNCSYLGLTELPKYLPANTTRLYLLGNKITDLSPLITNPIYRQVVDLYLDDNCINSIAQLEGSYWLEHFRVFSLRGNKLYDLPAYALENVLLKSGNAVSIYLGNNPWTCDCFFTPGFQDLLIKYSNIVKDLNDVRCRSSSAENDANSAKIIKDLTRTEICLTANEEESSMHPLDILNVILGSIIIFIIGKFFYDYWAFKKTGQLPWIVTKIP